MINNILNFNAKVDEYLKVFHKRWPNEKNKWMSAKQFEDNFNIDAPNLAENIDKSINKRFLTSNPISARKMLIAFAEYDQKRTRTALEKLFDENEPLLERIKIFMENCEDIKKSSNVKSGTNWGRTGFTLATTLELLSLRHPNKYYGYRMWKAKAINEAFDMGYNFKKTNINRVLDSEKAQKEIHDLLVKNSKFKETIANAVKDVDCYSDQDCIIATSDFCVFIGFQYKKPNDKVESNNKQINESNKNYWWLNAKSNEFPFSSINLGDKFDFAISNPKGSESNINKNFDNISVGESVILCESDTTQKIVGLGKIEHTSDSKTIGIIFNKRFDNPVPKSELKVLNELKNSQLFVVPDDTLLALKENEFNAINNFLQDHNPVLITDKPVDTYSEKEFLSEVFMSEDIYKRLKTFLDIKLNIILQGPPGVGKTFVAKKRLAYSIMGKKDDSKIEFIQFHQNYSYEDFVLGYKPDGEGFKLEEGVFTRFCRKAIENPNEKYFFIIDEINRGNMSKIFGELLMAIEYRDEEITLAYAGKKLKVPKNVYIIGMMNTADRSLAIIDYALRRRFGFVDMKPAFESDNFKQHIKKVNFEPFNSLIESIKILNEEIIDDDSLGEGFCIGHSYFCNESKCNNKEGLQEIIEFEILPTLKEYWFDDKQTYEKWKSTLINAIK